MKKNLLLILISVFSFHYGQSQNSNLRIIYNAAACSGSNPLIGATSVYLFAGCGTTSPSSTWEHSTGNGAGGGIGEMTNIGQDVWAICINPHSYFNVPANQTIYNVTMYFRNLSGSIFTGNCQTPVSSYAQFDWVSSQWTVANGSYNVTPDTCSNPVVGISSIDSHSIKLTCSPNPMQSFTDFSFFIPGSDQATISIYNILGKKVRTLISETRTSSLQKLHWDGTSDDGTVLSGGCYFYSQMLDGKNSQTGKIIISR